MAGIFSKDMCKMKNELRTDTMVSVCGYYYAVAKDDKKYVIQVRDCKGMTLVKNNGKEVDTVTYGMDMYTQDVERMQEKDTYWYCIGSVDDCIGVGGGDLKEIATKDDAEEAVLDCIAAGLKTKGIELNKITKMDDDDIDLFKENIIHDDEPEYDDEDDEDY